MLNKQYRHEEEMLFGTTENSKKIDPEKIATGCHAGVKQKKYVNIYQTPQK